jgi:hypothetical protein
MAVKLQFRRDTAANWESENTILSEGELGLDTTNERFKIGNGVDGWNQIDFAQYTNKAETFSDTVTLAGSDGGSSDWAVETSGDWEGTFTINKTINGIITTDTPLIDLDLSNADATTFESIASSFARVFKVEVSANNTLKFYALEEPAKDIPLNIKVVR